jgi:hypothetical protein
MGACGGAIVWRAPVIEALDKRVPTGRIVFYVSIREAGGEEG